ncbi:MAG TPA: T9SS type A sorting domain-containing protein, partial [Flavobacteriales bacterium]|nr:T9SS type A sorting domain-containing protein [Flavobacteriales bacterium]
GVNDAGITDIIEPTGLVCTSFLAPKVALTNFGEATLTSVDIVYDLNGGGPGQGPFIYTWTGSLPYEDTLVVDLPGFTAPYGTHTLNVTVQNPNGQPDEIAVNSSLSEPNIDVTGETVVVEITTDNDPSGIYWEIQDQAFQSVAVSPLYNTANTTETLPVCLSTLNGNCFSFYLFDFLGDGLSGTGNGNGSWRLRTTDGRTLLGDNFDGTINGVLSPNSPPATSGYVSGHEFCLPAGPSQPLAAECGVFTNLLQSKVFTSIVPGVTTYQFEFSDPDAGFRRRIAVPRNWVKFSEMVTSPLLPGVRYFTRVRVDQGASGFADDRFGTGCEMGLDPSAVPGCTGLVDNIGFPAHSCGVIRTFGGSDKVFAQPVVGATQYRFRFANAGEGYLRTILRPNYICPLSWVTLPLQNGVTYDVSVEVFYAGQWSGYCGPVCQVTILNPPAMAQQRDAEVVTNSGLQAWPNPVRDGVVNIRLDGLTAGTQRVSLEVYDLTGKRVVARDMENSGPVFNTVLELDGFAGGVYMVHLNVDGTVHQQRISVVK